MNLVRINDVVGRFGISSRTLRYYEQVGLLWSAHPENKVQRFYDEAALERLKQILVLRKLQIPIKDIVTIFRQGDTAALTHAFVDKLDSLDGEIAALYELRRLVDDFLHQMITAGIKKISAITLLYEETEKRLSPSGGKRDITLDRLARVSREALRLHDVRLIRLPAGRVLTSRMKNGEAAALDAGRMENLFSEYGLMPTPGLRDCFYLRQNTDEWIMALKIPEDFDNATPYIDAFFGGGLYAVASSFMEDMDETFALLRDWIKKSAPYAPDTDAGADMYRCEMVEEILPWDIANTLNRYQQDVFIPIRLKD